MLVRSVPKLWQQLQTFEDTLWFILEKSLSNARFVILLAMLSSILTNMSEKSIHPTKNNFFEEFLTMIYNIKLDLQKHIKLKHSIVKIDYHANFPEFGTFFKHFNFYRLFLLKLEEIGHVRCVLKLKKALLM